VPELVENSLVVERLPLLCYDLIRAYVRPVLLRIVRLLGLKYIGPLNSSWS
jgi:hypothetical protein